MLTSIIRKNKPGILRRVFGGGDRPLQQQQPSSPPFVVDEQGTVVTKPLQPGDIQASLQFMDKGFYNRWLNEIKMMWPKGQCVTLRIYPVIVQRLDPPPFWIIDDYQEMRHLATWDTSYRQPRAVGLKSPKEGGGYMFVAPVALRKLTDQEKFLVNIQDQKTKDARRETSPQTGGEEGDADDDDCRGYCG